MKMIKAIYLKIQQNLVINLDQKLKKVSIKKRDTYECTYALYEGPELTFNALKTGIFSIKAIQGEGLKISTRKQILQRLPIALAQVKASNISENLLNEVRQIIYFLNKLLKSI